MFLLILFLVGVGHAQDQSQVDSLVNEIESFINSTETYTAPLNNDRYFEDSTQGAFNDGVYDFIIVGAGSAGSVLANRLSEIFNWNILLLEAGRPANPVTNVPGIVNYLRISDYNWGYNSTPQTHGLGGFIQNSLALPRGRAVGGSSVLTAMVYTRGNRRDYDNWAALGNPGWDYASVLPYFIRSEHSTLRYSDVAYHGYKGPVNVEDSRIFTNLSQAFLNANLQLGRSVLDFNGPNQLGFGVVQFNEINGMRDSAARSFVRPIVDRPNLRVQTDALVTKVMISPVRAAYGVRYVVSGQEYYALAQREIILSAGSLNTPQILMLSGVGPAAELAKHGIPLIRDLPVGQNLWDHLIMDTQCFGTNFTFENSSLETQVREYLNGQGPLSNPGGIEAMGFVNLLNANNVPDIEHVFQTGITPALGYNFYRDTTRYTLESYENMIRRIENRPSWFIHSILLHPKSRGHVTLKSASPRDFPLVNPNYFSDPAGHDITILVAAIRDAMRIANTTSLRQYTTGMLRLSLPQCLQFAYNSDAFWRCQVRNLANTVYHYGGTAKMGPYYDRTAVVDHNLRVHGIRNLRVVDNSVIPITISGHTNAAANMIGEKAADIIRLFQF